MKNIVGFFRSYRDEAGRINSALVSGLRAKYFLRSQEVKKSRFQSWDGLTLNQWDGEGYNNYRWFISWGGQAVGSSTARRNHIKRLLKGMRKHPERFIFCVNSFSYLNSEMFGNYLNQRERVCFVTGKKSPYYRLGGGNTYYSSGAESVSLEGRVLHRDITSGLDTCSGCDRRYVSSYQQGGNLGIKALQYYSEMSGNYCPECSDDMGTCETCETLTMGGMCSPCATHEDTNLHQWGYTPPFWKYGRYDGKRVKYTNKPVNDTEYLQGLEFEFEFPDGRRLSTEAGYLKNQMEDDYIYFTTDSSLQNGIELHTQPSTLEAIKRINWDSMYSTAGAVFRSSRNGVHVHTNRTAYKPLHMARIAKFHRQTTGLTMAVADRVEERQFSSYARFHDSSLRRIEREAINQAKRNKPYFSATCGDRTDAINCTKSQTIEFRWGGGCETKADLFRKLEYIDAVFKYTLNASNLKLKGRYFGRWVSKQKTYPHLNEWLQTKKGKQAIQFSGNKPEVFR